MYEKSIESKITRVTHKVSWYEGASARSLKDSLANVPDDAIIGDITADVEKTAIEFHEEKEQ